MSIEHEENQSSSDKKDTTESPIGPTSSTPNHNTKKSWAEIREELKADLKWIDEHHCWNPEWGEGPTHTWTLNPTLEQIFPGGEPENILFKHPDAPTAPPEPNKGDSSK